MKQSNRPREQSKRQKAASQSSVYLATAIQDEGSFRGALIGSWTEDTDIHNQQIEHLADAFARCSFAFGVARGKVIYKTHTATASPWAPARYLEDTPGERRAKHFAIMGAFSDLNPGETRRPQLP